jgi:hypothetical protein
MASGEHKVKRKEQTGLLTGLSSVACKFKNLSVIQSDCCPYKKKENGNLPVTYAVFYTTGKRTAIPAQAWKGP